MKQETIYGIVAGAFSTGLLRWLDPTIGRYIGYTTTQYAVDLKSAGYVLPDNLLTKSDAEIGTMIYTVDGVNYAKISAGTPNLTGTAGLKANQDTYRAAMGQKLKPAYMVSGLGAVLLGGAVAYSADSLKLDKLTPHFWEVTGAVVAAGGAIRSIGIFETKAYPSGFDIKTAPVMQVLGNNSAVMDNLRQLSSANSQLNTLNSKLQTENAQLRAAGNIQISELPASQNRPGLITIDRPGYPDISKEVIRQETGLQVVGLRTSSSNRR